MDQVAQQNAAMIEQSTAAAPALAHDIAELAQFAARFRLEAVREDRLQERNHRYPLPATRYPLPATRYSPTAQRRAYRNLKPRRSASMLAS